MGFIGGDNNYESMLSGSNRSQRYALYRSAYDGYISRGLNSVLTRSQSKQLKFNLCRPICNLSAGWAAGPRVGWSVVNDEALTKAAEDIWKRSEGDSEFLIAALSASILGDLCAMPKVAPGGAVTIEFIDPSICYPTFDPHDCRVLTSLTISYNADEEPYQEVWTAEGLTAYTGKQKHESFTPHNLNEVPAIWSPNLAIKGQQFGDSDLAAVLNLIIEYDHANDKQGQIIDRYAHPTILAVGVNKKDADLAKNLNTVWYIDKDPSEVKISYLEWQGTPIGTDAYIERLRSAISEIAEVPAIAFGQIDKGFSVATGVALKVLYGPLEDKTRRKRAIWEPRLEHCMAMALRAEGYDVKVEDVEVVWAESAPHNEAEALNNLLTLKSIGASPDALLKRAGLSPDEILPLQGTYTEPLTGTPPITPAPVADAPGGQ